MADGDGPDIGTILLWVFGGGGVLLTVILALTLPAGSTPQEGSSSATPSVPLTLEQRYPIGLYPAWIEQMVMQPCETRTTVTFCTCVMSYVEARESAEQFAYEAQAWDQTGRVQRLPPTAMAATYSCPNW